MRARRKRRNRLILRFGGGGGEEASLDVDGFAVEVVGGTGAASRGVAGGIEVGGAV